MTRLERIRRVCCSQAFTILESQYHSRLPPSLDAQHSFASAAHFLGLRGKCRRVCATSRHENVGKTDAACNVQENVSCGAGSSNGTFQLVREYIHDSLYNAEDGYFSTKADVVGIIPEPIDFKKLQGRDEYRRRLGELYRAADVSWLTPVEVFKPWYGYALGEYILRMHDAAHPLKIYEIGAGSGTCALTVMECIRQRGLPKVYRSLQYTSVEISAALAERQLSRVRSESSHGPKFSVRRHSASDRSAWGKRSEEPCFVIMLEVLDNLPHDRVERRSPSSPWQETWVQQAAGASGAGLEQVATREVLRPLQDPLLVRCMVAMGMLPGSGSTGQAEASSGGTEPWGTPFSWLQQVLGGRQVAWIPTGLLALLETLHRMRPNMTLMVADFSSLPDVKVEGDRAPLVASKKGGVTADHATYRVPKGSADIFFPTDFSVLQRLDQWCARNAQSHAEATSDGGSTHAPPEGSSQVGETEGKRVSAVIGTADFMRHVADIQQTQTVNGFNPLLEDYSNTKFYLSAPQHAKQKER